MSNSHVTTSLARGALVAGESRLAPPGASAPPPSSPLQTALADAALAEALSTASLSVRSQAARDLPAPTPAPREDSTPLLGELPPPKQDRLVGARVLVASLVAAVVLGLALTQDAIQSSAVDPAAPTAPAKAISTGCNASP